MISKEDALKVLKVLFAKCSPSKVIEVRKSKNSIIIRFVSNLDSMAKTQSISKVEYYATAQRLGLAKVY